MNNTEIIEELKKRNMYFDLLYIWFWGETNGFSVAKRLNEMGVRHIAIYGLSQLGVLLYNVVQREGIRIDYVVDKNKQLLCECKVFCPDEVLPKTDLIIITAEYDAKEIESMLKIKNAGIQMISLMKLISESTGIVY